MAEIAKMIKHVGGKWVLYTRDGKRVLGTHDTREEAVAQEQAILSSQARRLVKSVVAASATAVLTMVEMVRKLTSRKR